MGRPGRPRTTSSPSARGNARIELTDEALTALAASREIVDALAAKPEPVYGVSTGFGALASRHIGPDLRAQLQRNIVRSHAAGMGPRVEREVVRALMFLRLKTVCSGHTGVRPEVARTMADVLNAGITPVVHEYGSLGCSGDLAPLSHCALALMGEGDAEGPDGELRPAGELLAAHGIKPVELREKEGLALLNGTDGMLGMLLMALADLDTLYKSADVTAALTLEALLGTDRVLAPELHAIRPHPGQGVSAANMLKVLAGSGLTGHHQDDAPRVQDAYSVRCAPQVAGAGRDTVAHARLVAERELAAAVDNPACCPGTPQGPSAPGAGASSRTATSTGLRSRTPGLPRHRGGRPRLDRRAAHGPAPRQEPLARPPAVPRGRRGRRLRPDDRPARRRPWWSAS
ncbi:Histidine ammonia-lyase [Streptomyces alboniger]